MSKEFILTAHCRATRGIVAAVTSYLNKKACYISGLHQFDDEISGQFLVSKFDHCLNDFLYRYKKNELKIDITAIVSNHEDLRPMAECENIRFIYLPVTKINKPVQEQALLDIVLETKTDLAMLA